MASSKFDGQVPEKGNEWSDGPESPVLAGGVVHVWLADLAFSPDQLHSISKSLSRDEIDRAKRYRLKTDKDRFLTRHGILRILLGQYLHISPEQVNLSAGKYGKPHLAGDLSNQPIEFSLAFSGSIALFAFCLNQPVGVDIERVDPNFDYQGVMSSYFSDTERRWLQSLPQPHRRSAFYLSWVRKEAYLKGIGVGFSQADQLPALHLTHQEYIATVLSSPMKINLGEWFIYDLHLPSGYLGSLAVRGVTDSCNCWKFIYNRQGTNGKDFVTRSTDN